MDGAFSWCFVDYKMDMWHIVNFAIVGELVLCDVFRVPRIGNVVHIFHGSWQIFCMNYLRSGFFTFILFPKRAHFGNFEAKDSYTSLG